MVGAHRPRDHAAASSGAGAGAVHAACSGCREGRRDGGAARAAGRSTGRAGGSPATAAGCEARQQGWRRRVGLGCLGGDHAESWHMRRPMNNPTPTFADAARDPWAGSPQQRQALQQQLADVQARLAAKEESSRKYKDAVRALKVRPLVLRCSGCHSPARECPSERCWGLCCSCLGLQQCGPQTRAMVIRPIDPTTPAALQAKLRERDDALEARQAQVLELHTELSQLQRMLQQGPLGQGGVGSPGGCGGSQGRRYCLTPPRRLRSGGGSGGWPAGGGPHTCTLLPDQHALCAPPSCSLPRSSHQRSLTTSVAHDERHVAGCLLLPRRPRVHRSGRLQRCGRRNGGGGGRAGAAAAGGPRPAGRGEGTGRLHCTPAPGCSSQLALCADGWLLHTRNGSAGATCQRLLCTARPSRCCSQVNSLQAGLREKDGLLQRAVADAGAAEARRKDLAAKLAEATRWGGPPMTGDQVMTGVPTAYSEHTKTLQTKAWI